MTARADDGNPVPERVEIPLEQAFAPTTGFDDNDNVQVVVHGNLPNACYSLADTYVEHKDDGVTLAVKQYALRKRDGVCAQSATLPVHMQMFVPFQKEVEVGHLPAASYTVEFWRDMGRPGIRSLVVSPATKPTIDSLNYAATSTLAVSDVVNGKDEVKVQLRGVLNSSCTRLTKDVRIVREDDVQVLLPTIEVREGVLCSQVLIPFRREVNLGKLVPGQYLVHVRSMNGRALNHVVHVMK